MQKISFALCLDFEAGISISGELAMNLTDIPPRASRQVATEYDDKLDNTPRSALRYRPLHNTDDLVEQPIEDNRITGKARLWLYILLIACVAFLISGINAPMLAGNVITLHIPLVWVVGIVAISIVAVTMWKSR